MCDLFGEFLWGKFFYLSGIISLAWVTLYRLGDPSVFSHTAPAITIPLYHNTAVSHERTGVGVPPPEPSPHVAQGAVRRAHAGGAAACCSAMGANAGAAALDLIRPAVGTGAVCYGQAGDGELDAVDGGAGHRVGCGVLWNSTG